MSTRQTSSSRVNACDRREQQIGALAETHAADEEEPERLVGGHGKRGPSGWKTPGSMPSGTTGSVRGDPGGPGLFGDPVAVGPVLIEFPIDLLDPGGRKRSEIPGADRDAPPGGRRLERGEVGFEIVMDEKSRGLRSLP